MILWYTEILQLTDQNSWRFCPGKANPSDNPSRSCFSENIVNSELWWHGPSFLQASTYYWPDMPMAFDEEKANEELVRCSPAITFVLVSVSDHHDGVVRLDEIIHPERYGSITRLLRVTALVLKFVRLSKECNKTRATSKFVTGSVKTRHVRINLFC